MKHAKKAERLVGQVVGYVYPSRERVTVIVRGDQSSSEFTIPVNRYGDVKEIDGEEIIYTPQELACGSNQKAPYLKGGDYVLMDFCVMTCTILKWRLATAQEIAFYC